MGITWNGVVGCNPPLGDRRPVMVDLISHAQFLYSLLQGGERFRKDVWAIETRQEIAEALNYVLIKSVL